MNVSRGWLLEAAEATGFRPQIIEQAACLLGMLGDIQAHPVTKGKLALKGGSALNLFVFNLPRLSVDIDLNYIGAAGLEEAKKERPLLESALQEVFKREGLDIERLPQEHAGGKWRLRYESALGGRGTLEVDLNFLLRIPLWPVVIRDSRPIVEVSAKGVPVLDIHELAGGKLAALLTRQASRDLFDAYLLFSQGRLDPQKLRLAFVVYGAGSRTDWRTITPDNVGIDRQELHSNLIPVLQGQALEEMGDLGEWAETMAERVRQGLGVVLPLTPEERKFLDALLDEAEIRPELLTPDAEMAGRIRANPLLNWKAKNVREYKRL